MNLIIPYLYTYWSYMYCISILYETREHYFSVLIHILVCASQKTLALFDYSCVNNKKAICPKKFICFHMYTKEWVIMYIIGYFLKRYKNIRYMSIFIHKNKSNTHYTSKFWARDSIQNRNKSLTKYMNYLLTHAKVNTI